MGCIACVCAGGLRRETNHALSVDDDHGALINLQGLELVEQPPEVVVAKGNRAIVRATQLPGQLPRNGLVR
jgi:hypothetical protein